MKIKLIFTSLFVCFQSFLFGQNYKLKVAIFDCSDNELISSAHVFIQSGDSLIRIRESKKLGGYETCLEAGKYQLSANYYYYEGVKADLELTKDTVISLCLNGENSDSLLMNYKVQPSYILYIFGTPVYSDEYLSEIGKKYGVVFFNLGCTIDYSLGKHNQIINRILAKRNGRDWQQQFWKEVEQNKIKSSSYVPKDPDSEIDLK